MNKIAQGLKNMAEFDRRSSNSQASYSVYILDVIPLNDSCKYDFYVGSTVKLVEERCEEHKLKKRPESAQVFINNADVGEIRWDLMADFPKFYSRKTAERAEMRVARWLVNKGFRVSCNKLSKTGGAHGKFS